jgi:hypothetical protein
MQLFLEVEMVAEHEHNLHILCIPFTFLAFEITSASDVYSRMFPADTPLKPDIILTNPQQKYVFLLLEAVHERLCEGQLSMSL